jgi:hypothetical protein
VNAADEPAEAIEEAEEVSEVTEETSEDMVNTVNEIASGEAPLADSDNNADNGSWSLINLILAIAGMALSTALIFFTSRRRKEYEYGRDRRGNLFKYLTTIAGAAGLLTFILTEDVSKPMVITDSYTLLQFAIFALCSISAVICLHRRGARSDAEEDAMYDADFFE